MSEREVPRPPERTKAEVIAHMESLGHLDPTCPGCRVFYAAEHPESHFAPSHKASRRCESGKRPHCTCDTCF